MAVLPDQVVIEVKPDFEKYLIALELMIDGYRAMADAAQQAADTLRELHDRLFELEDTDGDHPSSPDGLEGHICAYHSDDNRCVVCGL